MPRKATATSPTSWTESQLERKRKVEAGRAVVANLRHDKALIAWAKDAGLYTRIDRRTDWGNPFEIGADGDRPTVIERFRTYVCGKPSLLSRVGELRGRVLGCWCHPDPCHGCVLISLVEGPPNEHDAG